MGIRVVAVDVAPAGPPSNFAWAGFDAPARQPRGSGTDQQGAVSALVAGVSFGRQAALLLESPLAQGAWILRQLAEAVPGLSVTTQPDPWRAGAARLLLAEALFAHGAHTGPGAGRHVADAVAVGRALVDLLGRPEPLGAHVRCPPHGSFNLLTFRALWAGLSIDPGELAQNVLVIRSRPEPGH